MRSLELDICVSQHAQSELGAWATRLESAGKSFGALDDVKDSDKVVMLIVACGWSVDTMDYGDGALKKSPTSIRPDSVLHCDACNQKVLLDDVIREKVFDPIAEHRVYCCFSSSQGWKTYARLMLPHWEIASQELSKDGPNESTALVANIDQNESVVGLKRVIEGDAAQETVEKSKEIQHSEELGQASKRLKPADALNVEFPVFKPPTSTEVSVPIQTESVEMHEVTFPVFKPPGVSEQTPSSNTEAAASKPNELPLFPVFHPPASTEESLPAPVVDTPPVSADQVVFPVFKAPASTEVPKIDPKNVEVPVFSPPLPNTEFASSGFVFGGPSSSSTFITASLFGQSSSQQQPKTEETDSEAKEVHKNDQKQDVKSNSTPFQTFNFPVTQGTLPFGSSFSSPSTNAVFPSSTPKETGTESEEKEPAKEDLDDKSS